MRTGLPLLAVLTTLALLAPAALAAEGQGSFVASSPVALWGSLAWAGSEEAMAILEHAGPADSWTLDAANLVVTVTTITRGAGSAEDSASTEEHRFAAATARGEEGAAIKLRLGEGSTFALAADAPAPASPAEAQRQPEAMVLRDGQGAPQRSQDCASKECMAAAQGGLALLPFQPFTLGGPLELALLPGGVLRVVTAEGEHAFASERRAETRSSGGVALPLLGTVAGSEERVVTETLVTLSAEAASVRIAPAIPGSPEPASPPAGGPSAGPRQAPPGGPSGERFSTALRTGLLRLALDGTLGLCEARGALEVAGERHMARGGEALVGGDLDLVLAAAEAQRSALLSLGSSGDVRQVQVDVAGDVTSVDVGGSGQDAGASLYQAAAVAGAAGAVSLLALFAPAAKYGFSRVVALPLYARLQRQELLDNRVRAQLLDLVRREPGASPAELAKQLTCSWNNLVYHLNVLEREGYLTRTREGRRWRFFPTGSQDHSALPALAALRNPRAAQLVARVQAQPGIAQHQLSAALAVQPSTVHWHMERLAQAGLVRAERDGRTVRYYEGPAVPHLQPAAGETAA